MSNLSAINPSLYLFISGKITFANLKVSIYVLSKLYPYSAKLCFKNPISKSALCATKTLSPIKSIILGITLSIVSASFTISSVI